MGYGETPDKQRAISRAVALNDACILWGNIFKYQGELSPEVKKSVEDGVIETAERFYTWLITIPILDEGEILAKKLVDGTVNRPIFQPYQKRR